MSKSKRSKRIEVGNLKVDKKLYDFVNKKALPGSGVTEKKFWSGFGKIVKEFAPKNRALVQKREDIQTQLDDWYENNPTKIHNMKAYKAFLKKIGYLVPEGKPFKVNPSRVDAELATIAGPQLVVPIMNARYALNAANARWGSLYDALYGTDAISDANGAERGKGYNPKRGAKVIAWGRKFLDKSAPLKSGKHAQVKSYFVKSGKLVAQFASGTTGLKNAKQIVGYKGDPASPTAILLSKNDLHMEIVINAKHPIGSADKAGVADIILE